MCFVTCLLDEMCCPLSDLLATLRGASPHALKTTIADDSRGVEWVKLGTLVLDVRSCATFDAFS